MTFNILWKFQDFYKKVKYSTYFRIFKIFRNFQIFKDLEKSKFLKYWFVTKISRFPNMSILVLLFYKYNDNLFGLLTFCALSSPQRYTWFLHTMTLYRSIEWNKSRMTSPRPVRWKSLLIFGIFLCSDYAVFFFSNLLVIFKYFSTFLLYDLDILGNCVFQ